VAVPSGGGVPEELAAGGVRFYPWEAVAKPGPRVLPELLALRRIVADFRPDLVHLHSSKAGLVGRLLLRGSVPTVMHPNAWSFFARTGTVRAITLRWERLAARWTDVVVCVSEDELRSGRAEGVHADYRVLPNAVDLDRFPTPRGDARERARESLGIGDEALVVSVGRLHRQKNQAALLDVWPEVRKAVPGARLVLLGEGPDRPALEARGVEGVELPGNVEDVRPWLQAASLTVQPSRWEGMSLAVLEAMASGRSVVVTDVPGMREVVDSGAGALVAPGDREELIRVIVERLTSPELTDAEGRSARRRVEERHDLKAQHAGIDRIYDELLGGRASEEATGALRVLCVQPYAGLGGSESWLVRLLGATTELAAEVILLSDGPLRTRLAERGIPVEVHSVGRGPAAIATAVAWLARRLRADPPDVVLANVTKAQLVAGPAGVVTGVPTVWAKHDHGYDRTLAVPLATLASRVIAGAEEVAEPTRRRDAVIIPPPRPDVEPASRAEARAHLASLGIELGDGLTLVMAGRLVPFKGVDDAIKALGLPKARAWRLVVLGEDDAAAPGEARRLRELADELGVGDRVRFPGHVPGAAHWLAAFDALALLTRPGQRRAPKREGFGAVAFEAMLAGVPVIAAEGGAAVRRLEGRAGIGVPPSDPPAVAAALEQLTDPDVRERAGAAGRELTASHPSAADCADRLVVVLREAAAGGRRRGQRRRPRMAS
jgi:glycosyltransferase involved in cell wall biosynthesis